MRNSGRIRAVFDCNTLVQAIAFPDGPAAACLELVRAGILELFVSKSTLAELRRVLGYAPIREVAPHLTESRVEEFLAWLVFRGTFVRRVPRAFEYPRDPDDEPYIDLALAAQANFLVSSDDDLLVLGYGHSDSCKRFRREARGIRVVDPPTFLRLIRQSKSDVRRR